MAGPVPAICVWARCRPGESLPVPPLLLPPFPDIGHECRERGRRLAAARIVKEGPGEWWTPIVQHTDELSGLHRLAHIALEGHPKAYAIERRLHRQSHIAPDQLGGR